MNNLWQGNLIEKGKDYLNTLDIEENIKISMVHLILSIEENNL